VDPSWGGGNFVEIFANIFGIGYFPRFRIFVSGFAIRPAPPQIDTHSSMKQEMETKSLNREVS